MAAAWIRLNSRLGYRTESGEVVHPSAHEAWGAEFSALRTVCGLAIASTPSDDLPELNLSRVPAQIAILVSGDSMAGIHTSLVVTTAVSSTVPVPVENGAVADQVFDGDDWYPIGREDAEAAIESLAMCGVEAGAIITLGQLIRLRSLKSEIALIDSVVTDPVAALKSLPLQNAVVPGIGGQLYDYQSAGVIFLQRIAGEGLGCILGDEMGLGKTLQVIALLQAEKNAGRIPCLVIAPATLLENWRRELAQFAPALTVNIHAGPSRAGVRDRLLQFDVLVTSYETAVRDEPLLASVSWNVLALDEAQNIKNPEAARTRCVNALDRRVSLAVTGTPVENRLSDLWSLANFALPGLLGQLKDFESHFENSPDDASRLAPVVAPILLRRRVSEVATDLPPRIDIPQPVSMTRRMALGYEKVREAAMAEYGATGGLVALQKLRMYCAHPRLTGDQEAGALADMPKYQRLIELLEEIFECGEKVLVFSTYTGMADIFMSDLPKRFAGRYFDHIDGRIDVAKRQPAVDTFSVQSGAGALFLNPKAAGTGLNITAANHVIHYNPEWNPALEDQASARAYRRKQTRPVTVHHLFFSDSIEETMIERLRFKRTVAEGAVTGHQGDATPADVMKALSVSPISHLGLLE